MLGWGVERVLVKHSKSNKSVFETKSLWRRRGKRAFESKLQQLKAIRAKHKVFLKQKLNFIFAGIFLLFPLPKIFSDAQRIDAFSIISFLRAVGAFLLRFVLNNSALLSFLMSFPGGRRFKLLRNLLLNHVVDGKAAAVIIDTEETRVVTWSKKAFNCRFNQLLVSKYLRSTMAHCNSEINQPKQRNSHCSPRKSSQQSPRTWPPQAPSRHERWFFRSCVECCEFLLVPWLITMRGREPSTNTS